MGTLQNSKLNNGNMVGRKEMSPLEFESGTKNHKGKVKKDELETNSSVIDVSGDNKGKEVERLKYDQSGEDHMSSGQGAHKKQKRKREKDGDDIVIELSNEKECTNDGEKSAGKTVEKVDSAGNVKKRMKSGEDAKIGAATKYGVVAEINNEGGKKKRKEKREKLGGGNVKKRKKSGEDAKIGVATEYGVVAEINNEGGKKKRKEKRETLGGDIASDAVEARVASKHLDVHVVEEGGLALEDRKKEKRNLGKKSGTELPKSVAPRYIEAVDVDGGKARKKAKSETLITGEDSSRNAEAVNVEDGKSRKKKAKSDTLITGEDSSRNAEAVNVEDGKSRKKKAKSETLITGEDSSRNAEAVNVEDGKSRKKKAKSDTLITGEDSRRNAEAVNVEDGKSRKKKAKLVTLITREDSSRNVEAVNGKSMKKKAKSERHITGDNISRNAEAVNVKDGKSRKKKAKSETHITGDDISRNAKAANVESGKKRKKTKSQKHLVGDCNGKSEAGKDSSRNVEAVDVEGGKKQKKTKSGKYVKDCNGKSKRVSFADDVEVFSLSDEPSNEDDLVTSDEPKDLVRGKRFSKEEDRIVEEAVLRYIEEHALGDDGLTMILRCKSHPEAKNHPELKTCWKDIGAALPWRPFKSVYYRAHILFERAELRKWTAEEYEEVRKFYKDQGADWRTLGDRLGKHRIHVKDAYRRIKLPNQKKGPWSQDEYETLFDLVNMDLRMKVFEEKKSKHGMLRDNICWEAISETLGTRTNAVCSMKWYNQLTSPLVSQNLWANIDDYRLLDALNSLDACCFEDVDWDDLLEHRHGEVCQKRWYEMVKHIGHHQLKSFPEQVEILSKRYLADLIEAREIYDNKPVVD